MTPYIPPCTGHRWEALSQRLVEDQACVHTHHQPHLARPRAPSERPKEQGSSLTLGPHLAGRRAKAHRKALLSGLTEEGHGEGEAPRVPGARPTANAHSRTFCCPPPWAHTVCSCPFLPALSPL